MRTLFGPLLFLVFPLVLGSGGGCGTARTTTPGPFSDEDLGDEDAGNDSSDDAGMPGPAHDLAMKPGPVPDLAGLDLVGIGPNCNGGITLKPADTTLYVDGTHQFGVGFHAVCGGYDVAPDATFTIDNAMLGTFNGAAFTSSAGAAGMSIVRVDYMGIKGSTTLTLKPTSVVVAPGTDMNAPNKFGGANDAKLAPGWSYPDDGVVIPPNLSELEFQFLPSGNTLFELSFSGAGVNLKVYTKCNVVGSGCAFTLDDPTWQLLSTVARGKTIMVGLRGTSGASVGSAPIRKLSFSDESITGGLYYWSASTGGIIRYDFGLRGQTGEGFYTPAQSGAMCVGCHALSRDGSRIAVGLGVPGPSAMRILDVASKKTLFDLAGGFGFGGSNYQTLTADAQKIITTENGGLTVRNAGTGALIGALAQLPNANMPDVSPDSTQVVFSRGMNTCMFGICQTLSSLAAGLYTAPFTGIGFGGVKTLVAPANMQTNYYPSYSPDGKYVMFNRASADSYDAKDARLMAVASAGGNPIDFAGLNANLGNTWPKWAPFTHHFNGSTIFWFTFSSQRAFGLRGGTEYQLWMSAVDTGQLKNGADAAFPAFRLPFQDAATGNHISQWAENVVRAPCGGLKNIVTCDTNEICVGGHCQPKP